MIAPTPGAMRSIAAPATHSAMRSDDGTPPT